MSLKKSISYVWFILISLPLLLILLSVFRTGTIDDTLINNDLISSIAFSPFKDLLINFLDLFGITPSGYLLLVVNYFSYLLLMLAINLIFKIFSFFFTLGIERSKPL